MKLYTLHHRQKLPISLQEAWLFFSDPKNLNAITPESMKFTTISGDDRKMFSGQIIHYKITPFPFISMQWVTEISHVADQNYFVDEQRFGPYSFWHHKHFFTAIDEGRSVFMEDIIHYKLPFGFLGQLFHPLIVKPRLKEIFQYRKEKLIALFGQYQS